MNKHKIIILDDSKVAVMHFKEQLEEFGYDVTTVSQPLEFFRTLKEDVFQTILIDYEMPAMSGPEVCGELKSLERYKEIPVIILTSNDSKKHLMEAIDAGADDFLSKKIRY